MKKIVAISDVHIKRPGDEADQLLNRFLIHPEVISADYILLLGDVFDLMCGSHQEYLQLFEHHFEALKRLGSFGKKIYFFEGNHDVHLQSLFSKFFKKNEVIVSQIPVLEVIDGKIYYFSHGDEHEIDNISYQRYIKIIRSSPLEFVANHLMPYKLLQLLGENASKLSRKKGSKSFNAESVRERFRKGVIENTQMETHFVIGGHSHVQDHFELPETSAIYINNGYALKTKTFIHIEGHKAQFLSLG